MPNDAPIPVAVPADRASDNGSPMMTTARGRSFPLGVTDAVDGLNFVVFSRYAESVQLLVWPVDDDRLIECFPLDSHLNRTGYHWHIRVAGLPTSFRYGWRVDGVNERPGQRFNPEMILLDPFGVAVSDGAVWGQGRTRTWAEDAPAAPIAAVCITASPSSGTTIRRRSSPTKRASSTNSTSAASRSIHPPACTSPAPSPDSSRRSRI